jgi:DeoR/GlpR family transcriptional regulator of sugar metabolism
LKYIIDFHFFTHYNGGMKERRVFIEERLEEIQRLLREQKRITVKELCDHFHVSVVTIRNDLNELARQGKITRTHGGALAHDDIQSTLPFGPRRKANFENKQAIARAAAALVKSGEVIFIDGGTTAVEMPSFLEQDKDLTIITPSIEVAHRLLSNTSFNVYVLNGFLNRKSYSTIGAPYEGFMSEWNIAKAFCGAAGLTIQEGLTDCHLGFVEQKRVITQKAQTVVGLVDSTKLGIASLSSFASVDEIDVIVTDTGIDKEMSSSLRHHAIDVIVV